jgi:hypothetical protein
MATAQISTASPRARVTKSGVLLVAQTSTGKLFRVDPDTVPLSALLVACAGLQLDLK